MMTAIRAALAPSDYQNHVRVVCFMTDGEVGNDYEIIGEVQRHPNARVFAFGIGSAVNHFLLDNIAKFGRGEVEYVGLRDDGSAAARRFAERVRAPILTDVYIDWGGLPVIETYPTDVPDLFAAKPIAISGRYGRPAGGVIRLHGKMAGHDFTREIRVDLPASQPANDVLTTLWARRKVDDLMSQDLHGMQANNMRADLKQAITRLGIDYRLMTPFTSFVAVEETLVTEGGEPRRVDVSVEMPEGMSYEGVFGPQAGRAGGMAGAGPAVFGMINGGGTARQNFTVDGVITSSDGLQMRLGSMTENVEVTAAATPVQTASSENSQLPDGAVPNITMKGRDLFGVLQTVPGVSFGSAPLAQPSPAPAKLDPAVAALISRVESGARPAVEESPFVFGDEAYLRITLTAASSETLDQLRKAGFKITKQEGTTVTGHVAIGKVKAISELSTVQWIAPR